MGYLVAHEYEGRLGFLDIAHAIREQLGGYRLDVVGVEINVFADCEESVHVDLCGCSMCGCCRGYYLQRETPFTKPKRKKFCFSSKR